MINYVHCKFFKQFNGSDKLFMCLNSEKISKLWKYNLLKILLNAFSVVIEPKNFSQFYLT